MSTHRVPRWHEAPSALTATQGVLRCRTVSHYPRDAAGGCASEPVSLTFYRQERDACQGTHIMIIDIVDFDGPALLLRARGRINVLTAEGFEARTRRVIAATDNDVIIDTSEVTYLSTAGLRAFLLLWRQLRDADRCLYICGLKPYIRRVFEIIGFDQIIPLHDDVASALAVVEGGSDNRSS